MSSTSAVLNALVSCFSEYIFRNFSSERNDLILAHLLAQ